MTLPTPNLDDRRFQDLVDEAKRLVQQRCPEWTAHNVSDPGVTLIETFAMVADQLLYRLNRVPDRLRVRFLDLIGVQLHPPTAAHADVTFWLSAPQRRAVVVPSETEVSTERTETQGAIVFTTVRPLTVPPTAVDRVATAPEGGATRDRTADLAINEPFACFSSPPRPGDALLVGLTTAVPSCAVALRIDCEVEGVGVDPRRPPLRWEAWVGNDWSPCEVEKDTTGGFNRAGDVVLHVPAGHTDSLVGSHNAAWLRCQVTPSQERQPAYAESPQLRAVEAFTMGGTVLALNAEAVHDEVLGVSDGVPGQRFGLQSTPVLLTPADPMVVEVGTGPDRQEWRRVDQFAESGPSDRHFVVEPTTGELSFGPAVRQPDGSLRQYGATPPTSVPIRVRRYRTGGGRQGNVSSRAISTLRGSVPYVAWVENRGPASGGTDGETVEDATVRGPLDLRTRDRAVTLDDFEHLGAAASSDVGRVRAVATAEPGGVRVLVVPRFLGDEYGWPHPDQLSPPEGLLSGIAAYLDARRVVGTRVSVEPPEYEGVTVVARLTARPGVVREALRHDCLLALYRYLDPLDGGSSGAGWPFGRAVHLGEMYGVLAQVAGVEVVDEVRMFPADPRTGERGDGTQRIELAQTALPLSFDHQVTVNAP